MYILPDSSNTLYFRRSAVVGVIMHIRHELEKSMWGGESLLTARGPLVLVLNDLCEGLKLTPRERELALGLDLANEIEEFVNS